MQSKINKINKIILLSIPGVKRLPEVQKLKQLNLCEYDLKELTKHAYFSIILLDHEMSSTLMRFCWIVPVNCFIAWCWFLCSTWSASSEAAQHVTWAGDTSDQIMGLGFFLGAADNEVRADNHWQSLIYFSSYIPQPPWFLYQITTVTDSRLLRTGWKHLCSALSRQWFGWSSWICPTAACTTSWS